jgi:hypothetical protein
MAFQRRCCDQRLAFTPWRSNGSLAVGVGSGRLRMTAMRPLRPLRRVWPAPLEADIPVGASVDRNGWFGDLSACPASPRRGIQPTKLAAFRPPPDRSSPSVCWGVRMSQRCGACSCCRGSGNGYSPVYEAAARHRAFWGNEHHDDACVQQGQVDDPGATSARTPNILPRDHGAKYARQCP